jgi:hypothetical protein
MAALLVIFLTVCHLQKVDLQIAPGDAAAPGKMTVEPRSTGRLSLL